MIKQEHIGFHNGYKLWKITLANSKGTEVVLTNYSGAIMSIKTADKNGNIGDVVLGYDDIQGYINGESSQGALVGRFANRIGGGRFTLNGKEYPLFKNDGDNTLHGGSVGYNKRVWELIATEYDENGGENHVLFGYTSPDGEENFPGTVAVTVDYCLDEKNALTLTYDAVSSEDTILNLTNHVYFNLSGEGDIMDTEMQIFADKYTPVDDALIPTGEIADVKGTVFDFTSLRPIRSKDIDGYDHNFIIRKQKDADLPTAAFAKDPKSGRTLTCKTDMPAMQLYTANGLEDEIGKGGKVMNKQTGFCLETQFCPDSPNKPQFPSCVLKKDAEYHHVTVYEFGCDED
ncbi:MAG: galactose mutarotase [Ruminococcaceae bacterium]|nr:galactose mutarotase [Oscillospiraceae bacterium]